MAKEMCTFFWILTIVVLPSCQGLTLNITTLLVKPYLTRISGGANSTNPNDYEGLLKDLLDQLADLVEFDYLLNVRGDGKFGSRLDNGTWNGLIGDILYDDFDLAAAPFTVTSNRREVLDFSIPFQNFGPVILMKKPTSFQPTLGDRLSKLFSPLEQSVWLLSLLSYLAVSTIVYFICHCNPYEWRRMAKDGEATHREAESFSCYNSFWFILSSWAWQGYTRSPRSLGGRIVVMSWWIYIIFFLLTFTASLTNMLRMGPAPEEVKSFTRIRSLGDLSKQSGLDVGMLREGATHEFFHHAKVPNLRRIYDIVNQKQENYADSVEEGVLRVRQSRKSNYAFIMESAMAKYFSKQEPCDLYFVGDFTISGSYSFAYRKNWQLSKDMDVALLLLRETGILHLIEEKWFAGNCHGFMINPSQDDLVNLPPFYVVDLGSFSGALILLLLGCLLGVVVSVIEIIIYKRVELPHTEAREHLNRQEAATPASPETDQTKV